MNKRVLAVLLVAAVFLGMAACRKKEVNKETVASTEETTEASVAETGEIVMDGVIQGVVIVDEETEEQDKLNEAYADPEEPTIATTPSTSSNSGSTPKPNVSTNTGSTTKPNASTNSGTTTKPNGSTNSGNNTKPTTPTNPTNPTAPSAPTNPTNPTTPSAPTNPTNPTTPSAPTNPTTPSSPTTPTEKPEGSTTTQPDISGGVGIPEGGVKSEYDEYMSMSEAEQDAFINSFDSVKDFLVWFNNAKEEANANKDSIEIGSGSIDLSELTGNKK